MNKVEINQTAKVSIRWNVLPMDYSKERERSIAALFAKKYGIPTKNVSVETNIVSKKGSKQNLAGNVVQNINDPKFQHELFKEYIEENGIKDVDFEEILKIDSQINALIDYNKYGKARKYVVKWMKWSNILSYGKNNYFDFTKLKGLILLNGVPANKSGKSTFAYDLLHILLFGKTRAEKADTLGQLFNNYLPEETEASIEGCINIDGDDYIVKRVFTRPAKSKKEERKASQKIFYYRVNEVGELTELSDTDNLEGKSSTETNKIIKEAIGNEEDFNLIISANAKDLDELISLKETARGKLLTRWVGLSPIEDKDIRARELWNKKISVGRFCDIYNKETLKSEIESLEKMIKEDTEKINIRTNMVKEWSDSVEKDNKAKEALLSSKRNIDTTLSRYDRETFVRKREQIKESGFLKKEEKEKIENILKGFGEDEIKVDEEQYKKLQREKEGCVSRIAEIKSEITRLNILNKDLASKEYCPTCGRKFENIDNSKLISENKETIVKLTEEGKGIKAKSDRIANDMKKIEDNRAKLIEKNKAELKLSAINVELANLRNEYTENDRIVKELDKMKDDIVENNRIDAAVNVLNETIKTNEANIKRVNNEIVQLDTNIEKQKHDIKEREKIIVRIDEEFKIEKNWKLYLKMIGKDGISKMVLRNTLPIINGELHRLLGDICDFDVEVTINDKNDVEFWLCRDNVKSKLSSASGLETTQAALALRVVLGNMSTLSRPPFILLDEILGGVAKENYDAMRKLYEKIVQNYDFILHITHLTDIADWHTGGVVTVTKENNISSIKCTA